MDRLELNKAIVRKFLESMETRDLTAVGQCLSNDVLQHYQRPSHPNDDGTHMATKLGGRDRILNEIRENFYRLYREGTIKITIESIIAEGDYVAARFILSATTAGKGERYENFYHFHYRCKDGLVDEYWEYVDTLYAAKLLFS